MTRFQIQKAFKRICPPSHGEKQIVWFGRLARKLNWETSRIQALWKDDRCKISFEEGQQLTGSYQDSRTASSRSEKNFIQELQTNAQLRRELDEYKKQIKNEIIRGIQNGLQGIITS